MGTTVWNTQSRVQSRWSMDTVGTTEWWWSGRFTESCTFIAIAIAMWLHWTDNISSILESNS